MLARHPSGATHSAAQLWSSAVHTSSPASSWLALIAWNRSSARARAARAGYAHSATGSSKKARASMPASCGTSASEARRTPIASLMRARPHPARIVLGGVFPAIFGAIAGILLGISGGAYWAFGGVAAVGGFLAGFEHQDGWGGADRGVVGGAIYGTALLVAHSIAGTHAKVSL